MATADGSRANQTTRPLRPPRSIFDVPSYFFDSCRVLSDPRKFHSAEVPPATGIPGNEIERENEGKEVEERRAGSLRWTCNTCKAEFESLLDQRSHFKCDLHRLNVKLSMAGKKTIKEDEFDKVDDEFCSLFEDCDISSISGSEDDVENEQKPNKGAFAKENESFKQKIHICLQSGDIVALWKCLVLKEHEILSRESNSNSKDEGKLCISHDEVINRLKYLIHEPRDKTHLRVVLLASGGHFAGCMFDGNTVVASKTFHRYVVRAKAGKRQSANDATGKVANSAGSSLRRYNEAALKKEIQELLASWKSYFAASFCIWTHAPSKNHQLFFDGENSFLSSQKNVIQNIPITVSRPTLKEAKRVFGQLTHLTYVTKEQECVAMEHPSSHALDKGNFSQEPSRFISSEVEIAKEQSSESFPVTEYDDTFSLNLNKDTPLHEAAKSGDVQRTLELLEQGFDPCVKDSRGRTPYMLAKEKEVRNIFRRFMALNLEKWDWHAANVPSALTKEMEESQAAKLAEKDAKRKTKAKELKKLRKAKEKAKAFVSQAAAQHPDVLEKVTVPVIIEKIPSNRGRILSKEEECKRQLDEEREKRAAAAEKRITALNMLSTDQGTSKNISVPKGPKPHQIVDSNGVICSCCNSSLAGKVPFNRYHYKYCSTTCMHVHREMLEDG